MSQALFITDLLKELRSQYLDFLEDAIKFFKEYDGLYGVYAKKTAKISEVDEQLATIAAYKVNLNQTLKFNLQRFPQS